MKVGKGGVDPVVVVFVKGVLVVVVVLLAVVDGATGASVVRGAEATVVFPVPVGLTEMVTGTVDVTGTVTTLVMFPLLAGTEVCMGPMSVAL